MAVFSTCRPSELTREQFVEIFGGVYEHSPWVAELAYGSGLDAKFDDQEALHSLMADVLNNAEDAAKMQVVQAHPDLAGRAAQAGELTVESHPNKPVQALINARRKSLPALPISTTATRRSSASRSSWQ